MDMTSWCTENSMESKLEACLERIRIGRMWYIFDGLEKGSCTIKVTHDGDRVNFASTKTRKVKAVEPDVEEPVVEPEPEVIDEGIKEGPNVEEADEPEPVVLQEVIKKVAKGPKRR